MHPGDNIDDDYEIQDETGVPKAELQKSIHLSGMYQNWFLDYASYVILERAVPNILDGLKPVQRRILHAMKELDDGRFNKVANIIGHTMKYHPHGDASIGDALVQIGQKNLLVETQGNWGNILTGDVAAAPRYIEARLSKFAADVVFNAKTTLWKASYDGRNKEPISLPVKFPLLLEQGAEGIAVGLSSKTLPHNFNELIDASIKILLGEEFELYPDFQTGGMIDVSKYNDGLRGGRVRVRAKISQLDKRTLVITEVPFGTTTSSLIDSIITANEKGKIKIRKIDDNTADKVEILVHLAPDVSPDTTIDALYLFTDCEKSEAPLGCVIDDGKPRFLGVSEILRISTQHTLELLKLELEIQLKELEEQWHFSSLERIFIEKKIYRKIEECETMEAIIEAIDKGFQPYKKQFKRAITTEDIIRLTEIKIKRISKFDSFKADDIIAGIETDIDEVSNHLKHLIDYAINYFRQIKKKYGKDKERHTEIRNFDVIQATQVAVANQKLYVNRTTGFAGTALKKDEYVCDCSDIDEIIAFREDGTFSVTKVADKVFIGENIIHIDVFQKNDENTVYNLIYRDGLKGKAMVKRFNVIGVTRDKVYDLTKGAKNSKILYFSSNTNGETETVDIQLKPKPKLKKLNYIFDFDTIVVKGRNSIGNTLSKHEVRKITVREKRRNSVKAIDIWLDESIQRLNTDKRGTHLGSFKGDDRIVSFMQSGYCKLHPYELSVHFEEDMKLIEKYSEKRIYTVIYLDGPNGKYFVKRFIVEKTDKKVDFIPDINTSKLFFLSNDFLPRVEVVYLDKKGEKQNVEILLADFTDIKSIKAKGKRIPYDDIKKIIPLEPLPFEYPETDLEQNMDEENAVPIEIEIDDNENKTTGISEPQEIIEDNILIPTDEDKPIPSSPMPEINPTEQDEGKDKPSSIQMTLDF